MTPLQLHRTAGGHVHTVEPAAARHVQSLDGFCRLFSAVVVAVCHGHVT